MDSKTNANYVLAMANLAQDEKATKRYYQLTGQPIPKEELAINEAKKLGIPVVAICDSNANPDGVTYPVPGNDDALRAINLYCDLVSSAVLDGMQAELKAAGVDLGAIAEPVTEEVVAETTEA